MDRNFYRITEFARKASVSVRTLRYYDKLGLLVPKYNQSGYRLYTDEALIQLQYILSLKFLGFSLKEIKDFLKADAKHLQKRLTQQKAMMKGKITQIEKIIEAIENVENALMSNKMDYDSIINTIQVIQMKPEWVNQYLTTEERKTMRKLVKQSYSKEALQKLAAKGWTEEDHKQHINQYQLFRESLTKLVKEGASPDSPEAQELAKFLMEMIHRRSQDDPDIKEGMKKTWENFNSLPDREKPKIYTIPANEREFIKEACIIYHKNKIG
ncbi:MerR family transcriptional regulator [Thermaerobacillus caldiproteolyticus]|uniref:DNA-binding transcriptional MerR regulator n=1 Tax=Thermaerobacillus caldiproteolyticus TaxID=247480 RepID=A0A7W0C020_9BACL|nr:MerR family transcriptional regulator [Anoxybacillus caldiproteolyticus]MBA2876668.1 DNA-binding transcriptional MerR regulator [Anoxybacillus caldiproteolyticus]